MSADDKGNIEFLSMIIAGLFLLAFWIWRWENVARKWPQVSGVVVTSRPSADPMAYRGRGSSVYPIIEYEFSYKGQSLRSSHWRFGNFSIGTGIDAATVLSRYRVGSPVTVFVNPRDPTKSVLEAKGSLFWVPFAFGMLFLGVTAVLVLAALAP
jgi:hypothetical protein